MHLFRSSSWNALGAIFPAIVSLPSIGYLARSLNSESFGLFLLIFTFLGYSSLLDMGVSRSVVREVSINSENNTRLISLLLSALGMVLVASSVGAGAVFFASSRLIEMLSIADVLYLEAVVSLQLASLIIPPLLITSVCLAYFEGRSEFKQFNILRMAFSLLIAGVPTLFVFVGYGLIGAVIGLLMARLVAMFFAVIAIYLKVKPDIHARPCRADAKKLLGYGGWVTLSNMLGGAIMYCDRFVISSYLGAGAVPKYAMPAELMSRLLIIPQSITRSIFPVLCLAGVNNHILLSTARRLSLGLTIAVTLFLFVFSEEILVLWLGSGIGRESIPVFKILLVGFVFHSLSQQPYTILQANVSGLRLLSSFYAIHIIPYVLLLIEAVKLYGVVGVAVLWVSRMLLEWIVLERICLRTFKAIR